MHHQKICAIPVAHEELTSHKELSCSIAGRLVLLSSYFILIDQDSGVLLTYLCTGWVIPTVTNKSYYPSSTSLDITR